MSIKLQSQVWGLKVDGIEREILQVMCDHADDFGNNARPSIRYIAWKVGCEPRTVTRHLKALRKKGALELVTEARAHAPTVYRVNLKVYGPKPAFEYKGDTFHKPAPRGDIVTPDKLSPDRVVSPKPSSFNNDNNAPKRNAYQEQCYKELEQLTGGMMGGAEELRQMLDAWQKSPDPRRHLEAMRQTTAARSRTSKVYLKAYLTFNPDWKPPPKTNSRTPYQTQPQVNRRTLTD